MGKYLLFGRIDIPLPIITSSNQLYMLSRKNEKLYYKQFNFFILALTFSYFIVR